ncbi:MAG: glycosyltransferase family 2 protein [Candidatus Sabulitectum sp.]|nr:glycosyltransferase family 2 protein [Candidatus Sabulitectum sp.]
MFLPITVVTVAFGNPDIVREWVRKWSSVGAACLIVDNGNLLPRGISGDATVLSFTGNSGFGGGINRAVQEADTPVVLITNPDTLPENRESLEVLFNYHACGKLTGALTIDSAGNEVHSTGVWPDKNWIRSQIFKSAESLWRRDQMDWLQGSLIMIHKEDFLNLGGFSSRYPLYFEDVDICSRAREKGLTVDFCRGSRFIHNEGSGADRATATRLSCFHWGLLQFFRDHDSANADAVRKMIIAKCIFRFAVYAIIDPEAARGYYRALRSVLSGVAPKLPGALNG